MTFTKGNIIVEEIEIGDLHYEFEYGHYVEARVLTKPEKDGPVWSWKAENTLTGAEIDYSVHENYQHYGPNLYDSIVYDGCTQI